jgi:RNA polymerase sigma-70 factor, ECF subfamily
VSTDSTLDRPWPGLRPRHWRVTVTRDRTDRARPDVLPLDDRADDRTLVEACLGGHREAFDTIVERHQRQVYQLCYRFAGNHEDASDLAQDVFIRAYRGLHSFKGHAAFSTWLYRIAVNVCLNRVGARSQKWTTLDAADQPDIREERADARILRSERSAAVRAAIARLPKKQRAALILRVYHDLPHDQIAAIVGTSVGAVKANFFHALRNLKKLLSTT